MAVTATFYKTTDDPRTIDKSLQQVGTAKTCKIYNNSSLTAPTIILQYEGEIFGGANYCHLGYPFNRYYFMSPPQTMDGGRMICSLSVDVRKTWAQDISNMTCLVTRCENINNGMIVDNLVTATTNYQLEYIKAATNLFPTSGTKCYVLEVCGA